MMRSFVRMLFIVKFFGIVGSKEYSNYGDKKASGNEDSYDYVRLINE